MNNYIYTIQDGKGYFKDKSGHLIEYIGSPSDFKEGEIVSEDRLRFAFMTKDQDDRPFYTESMNGYVGEMRVAYKAEQQQGEPTDLEMFRQLLEYVPCVTEIGENTTLYTWVKAKIKQGEKDNVASDNSQQGSSSTNTTNNGWISVKDRLPEELDDVLVCFTKANTWSTIYMGWRENGQWHIVHGDGVTNNADDNPDCCLVTHWMELPPLPEKPLK